MTKRTSSVSDDVLLVIAVCKVMTFFQLSDLVCPLFFLNSATSFYLIRMSPLEGVTRGGPLVTPLQVSSVIYI